MNKSNKSNMYIFVKIDAASFFGKLEFLSREIDLPSFNSDRTDDWPIFIAKEIFRIKEI